MQPCGQEVKIARIEVTLDNVVELLEKHEDREERMAVALETVAAQSEAIKSLAENVHRHEKSIGEAFDLIRQHLNEKRQVNMTCRVMQSEGGIWILAIIALGLITDVVAHWQIVRNIVAFIRG